jgi:Flp pilus assembly protein TadB
VTLRRLAAALAAVAVALLVAAEFSTVFEVTVGSLEVVKRAATGGENHGYALLVVALFAVVLTLLALRGSAAGGVAGVALVALGAVVLFVALAIDRPDTRGSGQLPESLAYENAQARAGAGLGLEIAGGALLMVAGGLLSAATAGAEDRSRRARSGVTSGGGEPHP